MKSKEIPGKGNGAFTIPLQCALRSASPENHRSFSGKRTKSAFFPSKTRMKNVRESHLAGKVTPKIAWQYAQKTIFEKAADMLYYEMRLGENGRVEKPKTRPC